MIMGAVDDTEVEWAVAEGISFWIFEPGRLDAAWRAAERVGRPARIHLEVETGMHRTGLGMDELDRVAEAILARPDLLVKAEEFKVLAQRPVITSAGLLQPLEVAF